MIAGFAPTEGPSRRLGLVTWSHHGFHHLSVRVAADVPSFDDSMIRAALVRAALSCDKFSVLDRALNRELWPLGYAVRLERSVTDKAVLQVEVSAGR